MQHVPRRAPRELTYTIRFSVVERALAARLAEAEFRTIGAYLRSLLLREAQKKGLLE